MKTLTILLQVILLIITSSCTLLKDSSVNSESFLNNKENTEDIYSIKTKNIIYSPFNFRIESPNKIMLFDFEGHNRYKFLECQFYNDTVFGKGLVCMLMRHDDRLEIYHTKGVNMKQQLYYFDSGQHKIPVNTFSPEYSFSFIDGEIDFFCNFSDKYGNNISASLSGYYPGYSNFLVPVGLINRHHSDYVFFPLFYVKKINFLNTREGRAKISINNTELTIKKIPGLINWKRVYFARWSFEPVFVLWNKNFSGEITAYKINSADKNKPMNFELDKNSNHVEIKKIIHNENNHTITMNFSPAMPELLCLKKDIHLKGRFTIDVDELAGIIGGEYIIHRNDYNIQIKLQPTKGRQPIPGKSWVNNHNLNITIETAKNRNVLLNSKWGVNKKK